MWRGIQWASSQGTRYGQTRGTAANGKRIEMRGGAKEKKGWKMDMTMSYGLPKGTP